jgi:hypothetical protein
MFYVLSNWTLIEITFRGFAVPAVLAVTASLSSTALASPPKMPCFAFRNLAVVRSAEKDAFSYHYKIAYRLLGEESFPDLAVVEKEIIKNTGDNYLLISRMSTGLPSPIGARLEIGRDFSKSDGSPNGLRSVFLKERCRRQRLCAYADAVGKAIGRRAVPLLLVCAVLLLAAVLNVEGPFPDKD